MEREKEIYNRELEEKQNAKYFKSEQPEWNTENVSEMLIIFLFKSKWE